MTEYPLVVVGIGHDGPTGLSPEAHAHVDAAQVLAGGRRQLEFFPHWQGEKLVLGNDVPAFVSELRDRYRQMKTVVLASGDPLFYGIGRALLEAIPPEDLVFLPQVSSVQLAFARVKEPWHDARVLSLHGRPVDALAEAIAVGVPKIALLTDAQNHPAAIAELLRGSGAADEYVMWVCENLGGPDEQVSRHEPASMGEERFSPLNVVILLRTRKPGAVGAVGLPLPGVPETGLPLLGIPEMALQHQPGPRGMITLREVRLLALCYLELQPDDVFWDVGAGSGSVAIEAARLSPQLWVFAVEREGAAYARLEANAAQFGLGRVRVVCAEAPEGLTGLPDPDAVFIGGSGGRLTDILPIVIDRLKPGGRLVMNCISLENFCRSWEWLSGTGMEPEATSVQLAHSRPLGRLHNLEPENPIFILRARKR